MLPAPPDDHAAERSSIFEECAVRELLPSVAGDEVLDHPLARTDLGERALKERVELGACAGLPGFSLRRVDEVFLDRRFDHHRVLDVDLIQFALRARAPGSRR